ncbi:hypothetical protein GCM10028825_53340 [Spirosoma agri]
MFGTSSIVPAASGEVHVKKDKNKNYIVSVDVQNLAEASKLTPSKNIYLVWAESSEESAKKLGQLVPTGKVLKAELKATTIAEPRTVFITAEDNADVLYPDGQIILTTRK